LRAEQIARGHNATVGKEHFEAATTRAASKEFGMPANQLSSTEEKADLSTYWFVEATMLLSEGNASRVVDESERFIKEGIWRHNSPNNPSNVRDTKAMKPGEKIAIKNFHVRSSGLPFSTRGGNQICLMGIKVVGTITANDLCGDGVAVDWRLPVRTRRWFFHAQRYNIWGVQRGRWKDDALIDFAFYGAKQDIGRFEDDYPWLLADRKKYEAEEEKRFNGYIAFLASIDSFYFPVDKLSMLDRADIEAIYALVASFLEAWPSYLHEANPLCRIDFKKFDWSKWVNLANVAFLPHESLSMFLQSVGDLVRSLTCVKEHAKQLDLSVPQWAQERYDKLSETDKDVLFLVCRGDKNKDIAFALHMSEANVKKRTSQFIYPILEVMNRTGAARFISQYRPVGSQNRRRK